MTIPLDDMRSDVSGLIADWGALCDVLRRPPTLDAAGRNSQAYATAGSTMLWIQPYVSRSHGAGRMPVGVLEASTHVGTQPKSGFAVRKEDRVSSPDSAYVYDVLEIQSWPTHNQVWMALVKRNG